MIEKYSTKELKLNAPLAGRKKDEIVKIKVDKDGIPTERYWRDRLKDSKKDKCVEFVK